jgi:hypothetical protein
VARPGTFPKGQSGNPNGRPKKDRTIELLAREYTEAALSTLVEICFNEKTPPAARVSAASVLLDRGWGKARQPVEHSGELTHRYVVRMPTPVESAEEWIRTHAPKEMSS